MAGAGYFVSPMLAFFFFFSICLFEPVHPRLPVNSGPESLMSQDRNKDLFTHNDYTVGWVIRTLVESGRADPDSPDAKGRTPLS